MTPLRRHPLRAATLCVSLLFAASCDRSESPVAPSQALGLAATSAQDQIAFTSNRDGNNEIYVMNADGSGVTRLTDDAAIDQEPAWSPDGTRLAFTSTRDGNYEIYVMNADGSGVTRLTTDPGKDSHPAWCGTRIAFQTDRILAPFYDVYVMNDDGTGATRLTIGNASSEEHPAWSPSCDQIAYSYDPDGMGASIHVMNADGSGNHTLVGAGKNSDPAWSPDGTRIAFKSNRDADQPPVPLEIREIYVMNADGSGQTRLTHTDVNAWNVNPAWSRDGSQIAFQSNRDGDYEIYVMNADGTASTQVTSNNVGDASPAWSSTWPNEPPGFVEFNDQPWNCSSPLHDDVLCNGWNYVQRTSSEPADIVEDPTAPLSRLNVLRIIFTPSMDTSTEPGANFLGLPTTPREIYTGWWIKLSANWTPSPEGGGKMTFLFPWVCDTCPGQGDVYSNIGGSSAPHHINVNPQWADYDGSFWEPNVSTTPIQYDQWYRIEWYLKWESSPGAEDGILRWWVNGVLNGDYQNVRYPDPSKSPGFGEFQFGPTIHDPPPANQYMYIDHTHVSTPP